MSELYHHGILGQKWGIRRFQNKDGTLTAAGKERYHVDIVGAEKKLKKSRDAYSKLTSNFDVDWDDKKLETARKKLVLDRKNLDNEKIKERLNQKTKVSKQQERYKKEYLKQGMTEEDAATAAYRRDKTRKILMAVGGLTLAAASYAAYKFYDANVDRFLDSSKVLHNISGDTPYAVPNKGVSDAFFAAYNNADRAKYRGMFGGGQLGGLAGKRILDTSIAINNGLKVASEKSGSTVLKNLLKTDTQYASNVKTYINNINSQNIPDTLKKVFNNAATAVNSGKYTDDVYRALNVMSIDHSPDGQNIIGKLYQGLKDAGYDAMIDVNDKRYSGYLAKNPIIVFNGANKTHIVGSTPLLQVNMTNDQKTAYTNIVAQTLLPRIAVGAGITSAALAGSRWLKERQEDAIISKYRDEHPGTKLSNNEILVNELGQ